MGLASVLGGVAIGLIVWTGVYAETPSYFTGKPSACANCHAMKEHYAAWQAGPHKDVATCDDCHLPYDSIGNRYMTQAEDGLLHTTKFTFDNYPTNIVIRKSSLEVANAACLHCHDDLTAQMRITMGADDSMSCTRCHDGVGHEIRK
jgi:cytochrome c nitrite reductase small subunit